MLLCLKTFHDQFGLDVNTVANRPGYRTVIGVKSMHPLRSIAMLICELKVVGNENSLDDQDLVLCFDFACHFRIQVSFAGRNSARFQRAPEGSGQSTPGSRDNIIQCSRPGFGNFRGNLIMLGDLRMYSEGNGAFGCRQIGASVGAFYPFNANI
jgi:hypothetical protein